MRVTRAASIPLIVHDPLFSIWSSADHLYDTNTVHWCKARQKICGYVTVDNAVYGFMGDPQFHQVIPQQYIDVTATATEYYFENEKIGLKVRFTTPLLMDDLVLVSRPCTYVDFEISKKSECEVSVEFVVSSDLVSQQKGALNGWCGKDQKRNFSFAAMGRAAQRPLRGSGDSVTIDWGYAYLASRQKDAVVVYDASEGELRSHLSFANGRAGLIVAYDDTLSINYFGQWRKAYWTDAYGDIMTAIGAAFDDKESVLERASELDRDLQKKAGEIGGEEYAFLCNMSYRQVIAAHKLITDENGEVIFLSKENNSNGCISTVDVSYPSVPLFLAYNTEFVKGMMRPVFKFAACDVWEYDFAPHDVGRYPYACGQVYGCNCKRPKDGEVHPPYYLFPAGLDVYAFNRQMPVEESGNMLIMAAAVCELDQDASFVRPYMDVLKVWTQYLVRYGADPEEQLCTDDFAGHLAHNVNLSAKAIMGIEGYARIAGRLGMEEEAKEYHEKAKAMAADWERRANADDHYTLVFGDPDTWSLKYNLVWDLFFGSGLFREEVFEKEVTYYVKKTNAYGTPLDNRRDYTKSDWVLWCAAMAKDKKQAMVMIDAVANYLRYTSTRVPFSDWYETKTGEYRQFIARSVQGGIFMPLLIKQIKQKSLTES